MTGGDEMAKAERRRVRRRMRRARRRRRVVLAVLLLLGLVGVLAARSGPRLIALPLPSATATPVADAYDRTVQTREITLPEATWYAIQTGVFSTEEAAREKADAYAGRGAPGTVVQDGEKWRVFIACYGNETDAAAVRQRLGEQQRVETYLYRWTCPSLALRLTGMAGQMDVVEAGLAMQQQNAERLRDAATLLDAGELTATEASGIVAEMDAGVTLWAETARSRFGRNPPEIVARLLECAVLWDSQRKALEAAAGSPTELSASLKGQGMAMYDALICLRRAISGQ